MAQKQLIIEFKPKGDKALVKAIRNLDVVTNRLQKTTSIYEKELKSMGLTQKQVTMFLAKQNKTSLLGVKNNRLLGNSFATLRSKLLLVSFGLGLVTMGFRRLFDATIKQENAQKKLEVSLGKVNSALLHQASALQKVTAFGDEAVIEVQALIGAFTKDEEQIKSLTTATLDLAAAKGMDLTSAADLVAKSFGSSTNSLSRYGIQVDGAVGSSQRLKSLTESITELFGGQALATSRTLGGAIQQMTNAIGDANEAIGSAFEPFMRTIIKRMKEAAESARDFMLALKEDDLESIIRRLEELGVEADTLVNMKEFKLNEDIAELEKELSKVNTGFKSSKEVLEAIENSSKNLVEPQEIISKELTKQQKDLKFYNQLLRAQAALEDGTGKVRTRNFEKFTQLFDEYGNKVRNISLTELEAQLLTFGDSIVLQENKNKQLQTQLDLGNKITENAKLDQKQLSDILDIFIQIEEKQKAIADLTEGDDEGEGGFFANLFGKFQDEGERTTLLENINQVTSAIADIGNTYDKIKMQQINQAKQAELDTVKGIRNERIRTKKIEEIEAKYAEKTKKHKEKMKDVKVMEAVSNTALGVTAALSKSPPMSFIMAALVAAQGLMQIKAIKAQKYQYGGMVGGNRHSQGGTMIEAEQGEFVMSRDAVEAVGIENLNRMNTGLGGGGGASIIINNPILGKDTIEDEIVPQIKEALRRGGSIA